MTPKINILICDDHAILLEGLKVCLLHMPEVDKVAVSSTLHDATQLLESEQHFDLCIVDLDLPDGSGIDLIEKVNTMEPEVRQWYTPLTRRYGTLMLSCSLTRMV